MADTLNRLQKNAGRRLVLISASADGFQAALAERTEGAGNGWRIAHLTSTAPELGRVLAALPALSGVKHALLSTSACRVLMLEQSVPDKLPEAQVREMLRWEVDAAVAAENADQGRSADTPVSWETGHAAVSSHQTAVAAIDSHAADTVRKVLEERGLTLIGAVPSLALGWALGAGSPVSTAVVQQTGDFCALSVLERGQPEFFMTYPAITGGWSKNLSADARSFPIKKLVILTEGDAGDAHQEGLPGLPGPESPPDDWQWHAMLSACGLTQGGAQTSRIPVVVMVKAPMVAWKRPVFWWAAAAALVCFFCTPKAMEWSRQIRELEGHRDTVHESLRQTMDRLRAFAADAEAYDKLEAELKTLQSQIENATREAEKPGRAPCAQVAYVKDALSSVAEAFASRGRVRHFKTDYQGRVFIQGESRGDALVLDALETFYKMLEKHPVKPAAVSTTKEGAAIGSLLFTADDAANPIGMVATAPVTPAPVSPAAASSSTSGSAAAKPSVPVAAPAPENLMPPQKTASLSDQEAAASFMPHGPGVPPQMRSGQPRRNR